MFMFNPDDAFIIIIFLMIVVFCERVKKEKLMRFKI